MGNVLHINAMNYPLPLVRENSVVEPSRVFPTHTLVTDFGDGYRVVFFGDDVDDLLRRLGEAGKVAEHEDGYHYIYTCDGCKDQRTYWSDEYGFPVTCGECA